MYTFREARARYLREVMRESSGVVSAAAHVAGFNRTHFYRLLKRFGIPAAATPEPPRGYPPGSFAEAERAYLCALMAQARTVAEASSTAGVSRTDFYRLLHRHEVPLLSSRADRTKYAHRGNAAWQALR